MGKVKVLWGTREGCPEWQEELITEVEGQIPAASEWARKNGFDRLRVATIDLDVPPDFRKVVRV